MEFIKNYKFEEKSITDFKELLRSENYRVLWINTFLPSKILVAGINEDGGIGALCGIRSIFNILSIYISKKFQGKGIGSKILDITINSAYENNLAFIMLTVHNTNDKAFHLYSKFNFKPVLNLKSNGKTVMMLPLHFIGNILYVFLRSINILLPNFFWSFISTWIHEKTSDKRNTNCS